MQLLAVFLASLTASVYAVDPFIINTPTEVIQCGAAEISWSGGRLPYFIRYIMLGDSQALVRGIKDTGGITGAGFSDFIFETSYEFSSIAAPAGTFIVFTVADSTGEMTLTLPVVVSNSSDSSCLVNRVVLPVSLECVPHSN